MLEITNKGKVKITSYIQERKSTWVKEEIPVEIQNAYNWKNNRKGNNFLEEMECLVYFL